MPRKSESAQSLVAVVSRLEQHRPRIKPPPHLDQAERAVFEKIVADCPPSHFSQSDAPLLVAYCQAYLLVQAAFEAACDDPSQLPAWERSARVMASLSTKLRLAPSTRTDPKTLARRLASTHDPRAWGPKG
jgi:phage terminase small subunit